ncbi:MAG: phosphoglycerate kinase, partial [Bacteroidales bacterium]|nr:phosphoglycerate kinase [Bacteroidales bacterium]
LSNIKRPFVAIMGGSKVSTNALQFCPIKLGISTSLPCRVYDRKKIRQIITIASVIPNAKTKWKPIRCGLKKSLILPISQLVPFYRF